MGVGHLHFDNYLRSAQGSFVTFAYRHHICGCGSFIISALILTHSSVQQADYILHINFLCAVFQVLHVVSVLGCWAWYGQALQ